MTGCFEGWSRGMGVRFAAWALVAAVVAPAAQAQTTVSYLCDGGGPSFDAIYSADGDTVMLIFAGDHRVQLTSAIAASGARYAGGGYQLHGKGDSALLTRPGLAPVNCEIQGGGGGPGGPGGQVANPSFSCTGKLNPTERQICDDANLAKLDRDLASAYAALMGHLSRSEQARLKADQRQWLAQRNRCRTDVSCIETEYYDRIAYINEWEAPGAPPEGVAGFPHPAQSWGGVVRSGPGMGHKKIGSLREGAPITLLADTGVAMNGYNWFRIRFGRREGFQWGGIICPKGRAVPGTFQICN